MKSKIFVSWSKERSKLIARHLCGWLKMVVQNVDLWMSDKAIEAGQRWNDELSIRLRDTNFGVICLTPENLSSPWLLFEAGSLAKAVDSARVVPLLYEVEKTKLPPPLLQFQAVEANRDGILALVSSINSSLLEDKLQEATLNQMFDKLWPDFAAKLAEVPPPPPPEPAGSSETEDWQDYMIKGANLANDHANLDALRAFSDAICLAPEGLRVNSKARIYIYRAGMFKRLNRLEEAEQDLILAQKWAEEEFEKNDILYNMAGVKAMAGQKKAALACIKELLERDPRWVRYVDANKQLFVNLQSDSTYQNLIRTALTSLSRAG